MVGIFLSASLVEDNDSQGKEDEDRLLSERSYRDDHVS